MRTPPRLAALGRVLAHLARPKVFLVGCRASRLFLRPARTRPTRRPSDDGIPFEEARLRSEDGVGLPAWWMPAPEARGTVVFLHGYGANREQSLAVAPFLHRAGYSVLAFDFRGHGDADAADVTLGVQEVRDVAAALSWLRERGVHEVALLGWSMGGATAVRAGHAPAVRAVVADCPFATLRGVAARGLMEAAGLPEHPYVDAVLAWSALRTGADLDGVDPAVAMATLAKPVLLIHGDEDALTPWTESEALHARSNGHSRFWKVAGAHHVGSRVVAWDEYERRVLGFLEETLTPTSPGTVKGPQASQARS